MRPPKRQDDIVVANMVADMEVNKVADKVDDKVADKVADMVAYLLTNRFLSGQVSQQPLHIYQLNFHWESSAPFIYEGIYIILFFSPA